ncbi:MAG: GTPase ObgE [Zetaproteobacteria bacterium]|nr:GTPase ObgE [Pseudobdellovibrionaceae bacterium]
MKFVDQTEIWITSGNGGSGMKSFRSGKNAPKMGVDGGDGGRGGHVYLVGNAQLNTLSSLYYKQTYAAKEGEKGGTNGRTGANGEDLFISMPLGTVATDLDNGEKLCEVLEDGEAIIVAEGGKRGLGNQRFLSSTHQAPEEFTYGGPGRIIRLGLELKVIADVGFAGFPNAGKSTLLSCITAAKPKVADYPFTTLVPHLGVVQVNGPYSDQSFVAADIPGLIEGASEGKGLGFEFLKHLERTKVIVYVIDGFSLSKVDPVKAYQSLREELYAYNDGLAARKSVVVITKSDLAEDDYDWVRLKNDFAAINIVTHVVSSVRGDGLEELKRTLYGIVQEEKQHGYFAVNSEEQESDPYLEGYEFVCRAPEDAHLGL